MPPGRAASDSLAGSSPVRATALPRWRRPRRLDRHLVARDHTRVVPSSRAWGWIRSAAVGVAFIGLLVAAVALAVAARNGNQPWQSIAIALGVAFFSVWTFRKLTANGAVDDDWDSHLRFSLVSVGLALFGLHSLVVGDAGGWGRPLGLLGLVVGIVMLVAELRDFVFWRSDAGREKKDARRARAAAERRRPGAW